MLDERTAMRRKSAFCGVLISLALVLIPATHALGASLLLFSFGYLAGVLSVED